MVRAASPLPPAARARLEFVKYPLFDAVVLPTAFNARQRFFATALGEPLQNASVAQFKTYTETNMLTAGRLSTPKVFVIHGVRLVISHLLDDESGLRQASSTIDEAEQAGDQQLDLLFDMKAIRYGAWFEFLVSNKPWITRPCFELPDDIGIDGLISVGTSSTAGAGDEAASNVNAPYGSGPLLDLGRNRISLPPEQTFQGGIVPRQAITLTDQVKIWCSLEGVLGRETL